MQYIFGTHAVIEKINTSPNTIHKLYLKKTLQKKSLDQFVKLAKKYKIPHLLIDEYEIGKILNTKNANHQGVVVAQNDVATIDLGSFLKTIENKKGVLVLMHEMNDPHNVGAIIRSAVAFGALGVIIPSRNQSPINETVVKVSTGAVYNIPIIKVSNINQAVLKLKEANFWIYGLTEKSTESIYKTKFDERSVIIVGNEHSGIAHETLNKCDFKIQIPISNVDSLNASVSAGIALYEWNRNHS